MPWEQYKARRVKLQGTLSKNTHLLSSPRIDRLLAHISYFIPVLVFHLLFLFLGDANDCLGLLTNMFTKTHAWASKMMLGAWRDIFDSFLPHDLHIPAVATSCSWCFCQYLFCLTPLKFIWRTETWRKCSVDTLNAFPLLSTRPPSPPPHYSLVHSNFFTVFLSLLLPIVSFLLTTFALT